MAGRRPQALSDARRGAVEALMSRLRRNPPATPKQAAFVGLTITGIALSDDPGALAKAASELAE